MNWVEYKKKLSVVKCHLTSPVSPKWSSWHAVYSCNCDGEITSNIAANVCQGFNFGPDMLFYPFICHKKCDNI